MDTAGGPLTDPLTRLSFAKQVTLCPIHRSFTAMSGPLDPDRRINFSILISGYSISDLL